MLRDLSSLVLEIWQKTGVVPGVEALGVEMESEIRRRGSRLPDDGARQWRELLDDLEHLRVPDAKLILTQVHEWIQDRAYDALLIEMGALKDRVERDGKRDYDRIHGLNREFMLYSNQQGTVVSNYFENLNRRMASMLIDEAQFGLRIPTLISEIDKRLDNGPMLGEMVVWAAPTSQGKTYACCWISKACLYQGKKVAYVVCEGSRRAIEARIDRAISRMNKSAIRADIDLARDRIRAAESYRGELMTIELMGKAATVERIHAELEKLKLQHGFNPDVIIVDYPGQMYGVQRYGSNEKRHELAQLYRDIQALGKEFDAITHVPMQTNRSSVDKVVIRKQDVAECFEVAWMADIILTLCRTKEEEIAGMMRIYIAKQREGEDHFAAPVFFDRETGNFSRAGEAVLQAQGASEINDALRQAKEEAAEKTKAVK